MKHVDNFLIGFVGLSLLISGGCAAPAMLAGLAEPSGDSREGYERLIHIDEDGNVIRKQDQATVEKSVDSNHDSAMQRVATSAAKIATDTGNRQSETKPVIRTAQIRTAPVQSKETAAVTPLEIPVGVKPTLVRTQRFNLEYNDTLLGPEGIAKVELYGTRDNGRSWQCLGEDADRASPYLVEMPGEGVFGFRIAVAGKNGLASRAPQAGELPELWVKVDLSKPVFHGHLRAQEGTASNSVMVTEEVAANPQAAEAQAAEDRTDQPLVKAALPTTNPVRSISHNEVLLKPEVDEDWQSHLEQAIKTIEWKLASDDKETNSPEQALTNSLRRVLGENAEATLAPVNKSTSLSAEQRTALDAQLRMLYLVAGRRDDAIRSSAFQSTVSNEFWSHQMLGLDLLLGDDAAPRARQMARALREIRDASDKLAVISELQIRSLAFCTAAHSFGVYETTIAGDRWKHSNYREAKFEPEQPVVLYFEVDNFTSKQHASREYPDGAWRTSLKGSYTILDHSGRPVQQRELKLHDDLCRNRRHDYFVAYKTWMPAINPGRYTLELLVEDALAEKVGSSSIDFEIVER